MLVMHKPDPKDGNSVPFYIPLSRVPTVHKFDLEKVQRPLVLNIDKATRHKEVSKDDLKNNVQNGTIPEEDRFQTEESTNVEEKGEEEKSENSRQTSENSTQSVEYTSKLDVNLSAGDTTTQKANGKQQEENVNEKPVSESSL